MQPLVGVTVLSPAVGGPPPPTLTVRPAFESFEVLQAQPRTVTTRGVLAVEALTRLARAALLQQRFRPHAHGMTAQETAMWAAELERALDDHGRAELLAYVRACRVWERALGALVGGTKGDPDWDMTSARNVAASAPEALLARSLEAAGMPVQAQVGVAQERGGPRRGGWYGSFWLDYAHRDPAYLLRIDIELDGKHHDWRERKARDAERNRILMERGWYVVRIAGQVLGRVEHERALVQLSALVERHRRAVVLARVHLPTLERMLR